MVLNSHSTTFWTFGVTRRLMWSQIFSLHFYVEILLQNQAASVMRTASESTDNAVRAEAFTEVLAKHVMICVATDQQTEQTLIMVCVVQRRLCLRHCVSRYVGRI